MMETVYIVFGSHRGCLKEYILGCFKDAVSAFNFKEKYEHSEMYFTRTYIDEQGKVVKE